MCVSTYLPYLAELSLPRSPRVGATEVSLLSWQRACRPAAAASHIRVHAMVPAVLISLNDMQVVLVGTLPLAIKATGRMLHARARGNVPQVVPHRDAPAGRACRHCIGKGLAQPAWLGRARRAPAG